MGKINFSIENKKQKVTKFTFHDIHYVTNIDFNLLSVTTVMKKGFKVYTRNEKNPYEW